MHILFFFFPLKVLKTNSKPKRNCSPDLSSPQEYGLLFRSLWPLRSILWCHGSVQSRRYCSWWPIRTDPWHHQIDLSGHKDEKMLKVNRFPELECKAMNSPFKAIMEESIMKLHREKNQWTICALLFLWFCFDEKPTIYAKNLCESTVCLLWTHYPVFQLTGQLNILYMIPI